MGTQHGAPSSRMIGGLKYFLYKQYHNIDGGHEQERDKTRLKSEGVIVKSVNITKGGYTRERALYIRRP
jgi:hypothetical protein